MKACRKFLALILSLSLCNFGGINYQVYAADPPPFSSAISAKGSKEKLDARSLTQPLQPYARIGQYFQSTQNEGPTLIHIRDLHCNYEAQINISKTLESLSTELKKSGHLHEEPLLVLTEGAEGQVDTSLFASFPDNEVRAQAAREFVKTGKMTGPEYLSISKPYETPVQIVGIEEGDLYIENLKAFRDVIGQRQMTQSFINDVSERLEMFKQKAFSKELLEMDQKESGYQSGAIAFDEYTRFLSEKAANSIDIQNYPNFKLLVEVLERQKNIVVDEVETERNKVMDELTDKVSKDELAKLIKRSLEFRLGKISAQEYFEGLEKMMGEHLQKESYPNLSQYIALVKIQSGVDHRLLLNEVEDMTRKVRESLVKTGEEKELLEFSHRVGIVEKMFKLEMTREDLAFYKENKKLCNVESVMKQLDKFVLKYGLDIPGSLKGEANVRHYTKVFEDGDRFYEMALQRDKAMMARSMEAMEGKNIQVAVLITGGFHSDGVTELLERKDVAYVVATPKVSGEPDMTGYYNLMLDERITVATIAFVSLFNGIAGKVSPNLQGQELDRFADLLMRLMGNKGIGNEVFTGWIDRWVEQKGGLEKLKESQPAMEQLVSRLQNQLNPAAVGQQAALITDQMIQELMNSPNLVTAELTVEVLKEMGHPQLEQAQKLLDAKRRGLYSNMDEMAQSLPKAIGEKLAQSGLENEEAKAAVRLIDLVKGLYEAMGLMKKGYHNQVHNLGVVFANLTIATSSGFAKAPRDVKVAFLAAMLHDFHIREPTLVNKDRKEQGTPAFVEETIKQLRHLLGLPLVNGPPQEARYHKLVSNELRGKFQRVVQDLLVDENLKELFAEAEVMIRRTDFASNVAPPPPQAGYVKTQAAEARKNMDSLITQGKSLTDVRSAVEQNYEKIYQAIDADGKLNDDQKQTARAWTDRQKGIELAYLTTLAKANPDRLIQVHQLANRLEKGADQSGFYWLTTPEMVEKEVVPGLQEEIPMVNVAGSYPFFFVPELLNPEVLDILKDLPFQYKKNLIEVMRHFSKKTAETGAKMPDSVPVRGLFQGAQADWEKREQNVASKLGLEIGPTGEIRELVAPVISIATGSKVLKEVSDPEIRLAAMQQISETTGESSIEVRAKTLSDSLWVSEEKWLTGVTREEFNQFILDWALLLKNTGKNVDEIETEIQQWLGYKLNQLQLAKDKTFGQWMKEQRESWAKTGGTPPAEAPVTKPTPVEETLAGADPIPAIWTEILKEVKATPGLEGKAEALKKLLNVLRDIYADRPQEFEKTLAMADMHLSAALDMSSRRNYPANVTYEVLVARLIGDTVLNGLTNPKLIEAFEEMGFNREAGERLALMMHNAAQTPRYLLDPESFGKRRLYFEVAKGDASAAAIYSFFGDSIERGEVRQMAEEETLDSKAQATVPANWTEILEEVEARERLEGKAEALEKLLNVLRDIYADRPQEFEKTLRTAYVGFTTSKQPANVAYELLVVSLIGDTVLNGSTNDELIDTLEGMGFDDEAMERMEQMIRAWVKVKKQEAEEETLGSKAQVAVPAIWTEILEEVKATEGLEGKAEALGKLLNVLRDIYADRPQEFEKSLGNAYLRFLYDKDNIQANRAYGTLVAILLSDTVGHRLMNDDLIEAFQGMGFDDEVRERMEQNIVYTWEVGGQKAGEIRLRLEAKRNEEAQKAIPENWTKIRDGVNATPGLEGKAEALEKLFNVLRDIYADRPQEVEKTLKGAYSTFSGVFDLRGNATVAYEVLVVRLLRDTVLSGFTYPELIEAFQAMGFDGKAMERLSLMIYSSRNEKDYTDDAKGLENRRLYSEVDKENERDVERAFAIYSFFGESIEGKITEEDLRQVRERARQKVEEKRLRREAEEAISANLTKIIDQIKATPGLQEKAKDLERLFDAFGNFNIYGSGDQEFQKTLEMADMRLSAALDISGKHNYPANVAYEILVASLIEDTVLNRLRFPNQIKMFQRTFQRMGFDREATERLALLIYDPEGIGTTYMNDGDARNFEYQQLYPMVNKEVDNGNEKLVAKAVAIYSFFGEKIEGEITERDLWEAQHKAKEEKLRAEASTETETIGSFAEAITLTTKIDSKGQTALLSLEYPVTLQPVTINGVEYTPKPEFHVTVIGFGHKFLNQVKEKFGIKNNKEAQERARQIIDEAAQGITFTTQRTGNYRMVEKEFEVEAKGGVKTKELRKTVVELVDINGMEEFYQRLDAVLGSTLSRTPAHITLLTSGNPQGIGLNSQKDLEDLTREPTSEERTAIETATEGIVTETVTGRLAPHRIVNAYIGANIPQDLRDSPSNIQNYPEAEYQGIRARVIAIPGLFRNTGQLAHIGLGQVYGQPVIYVDSDYTGNQTVMNHELHEIRKWEEQRQKLELKPSEMRHWIKNNLEEARELANQWHSEAPSVEQLLAEVRAKNEDHLALLDQIYPEEDDINLAAGSVPILRAPQTDVEFDAGLPQESLQILTQLARSITTEYDEDEFQEQMGLIIGRQEGMRYTITKLLPITKFDRETTQDNLYPSRGGIIELIDKKTALDEKVLGFYHNHSWERLRSGAKPGPSHVDVMGDDLNIPGYENKIIDDRLGLVLEPKLDVAQLSVEDISTFDPTKAEVLLHVYLSPQRGQVSPGIMGLGSTPLAPILQHLSPKSLKGLKEISDPGKQIAARELISGKTGETLATTETLTTRGQLDQTLEGAQTPADETSTKAVVKLEDVQKQIQGQLNKLVEGGLVNPAELIEQLSRFVEANVPESAREVALRIAGEEVGKVINKGLPGQSQGNNHQILGDKQKERMAKGIATKLGIAKDRVMRFWWGLDREGILGPMWVNEKGEVEASGVLQRLLEKFLKVSGQKEGLAGSRIRNRLYHEYAHQILKAAMNENLQGQMKSFVEDKNHQEFMKAFAERYGMSDPEEILAKYVSYTFTGEDRDLFEKEARDPVTKEETGETVADKLGDLGILANVSFPRIAIRNEEAKQMIDELLKKSSGLNNRINKENPQRSLKEIMIEFRNLTVQGIKGENLPEEFRAVEDSLRPMLKETTLAALLIGEGGTSREDQQARLKALAKQVAPRINYEGQRKADQAVKRIMVQEASPVLNRMDALVSEGIIARVGEGEDRNVFAVDILALIKKIEEKDGKIKFEGTGVGLDQALEKLFGVRPGTRIKLMSPYSEERTREVLKSFGIPEERIGQGKGKVEIVGNWSEQGFQGIVRNALGVEKLEGEALEQAQRDVVVILSEETQKNLTEGREKEFKQEIAGMKVVVGKLGKEKGSNSIGDILGMALVLGSVEKAFDETGQMSPVLTEKLKSLFEPLLRQILSEEGVPETEIEAQIGQMIKDIAKEGFFRIPPVTDVFNDMMRELAIEEAYIEVAA